LRLEHCCRYPIAFYEFLTVSKQKGIGTTKKIAPGADYYIVRKSNRVMMIIKRKPSLLPDHHANVECLLNLSLVLF
jgi:hypothetical protein